MPLLDSESASASGSSVDEKLKLSLSVIQTKQLSSEGSTGRKSSSVPAVFYSASALKLVW